MLPIELQARRRSLGLSQAELAVVLNESVKDPGVEISEKTLRRWEQADGRPGEWLEDELGALEESFALAVSESLELIHEQMGGASFADDDFAGVDVTLVADLSWPCLELTALGRVRTILMSMGARVRVENMNAEDLANASVVVV